MYIWVCKSEPNWLFWVNHGHAIETSCGDFFANLPYTRGNLLYLIMLAIPTANVRLKSIDEMNEVSNIVRNAGAKSLVLLDEVGRGTGTSDGLALATAIITYITDKNRCNTMFATHFHELTNLASSNKSIKNYKVLTEQIDNEIVFLHKVEQGIEENSFGIEVAKMAGLPKEILDKAKKLYNKVY